MSFAEAVQAAINFERKGVTFYMELAAQTENRLGRRLFYTLAKEEVDHILTIESISRQIQRQETANVEGSVKQDNLEEEMKHYFQAFTVKDLQEKKHSNIEGYEMAMDIEQRGYEMYKKFYEQAQGEQEKEFFKMMMEEEQNHFSALQNVYYYLTSSSDWFSETESRVWNWMV